MCFSQPKSKPVERPAPAPAPAETSAGVAQAEPETRGTDNLADRARRLGRTSLRIDRAVNSASGGSGLNIPQG